MTVETPFRDFLAFWERAADRPAAEQVALWEELYVAPNRDAYDQYLKWFGDMGTLEAALPRYAAVIGDLESRLAALDLEWSAHAVGELLGVSPPLRAIAFVGVFTANAWVDAYDGQATMFFALEADPAHLWHRAISAHEIAHVAHDALKGGEQWADGVPGLTLLQEALALAASRAAVPDALPEQYYAVDDYDGWAAECRAELDRAREELLACLGAQDDRARRRFFWPDWGRDDHDVPERVGYFAAGEVVAPHLARAGLAEAARWPAERALAETRVALEAG